MEPVQSVWLEIQHRLKSYVARNVKDKTLSEDILHDVWIKVHDKSGEVRDPRKIRSWIFAITSNTIADHFRNQKKSAVTFQEPDVTNDFNECVSRCLMVLLETLPEKYRVALELTEKENLSQSEVAKRLNISYPGARSRVQRARRMLKDKLMEIFIVETDPYGNVMVCENRKSCSCEDPAMFWPQ